LKRSEAKRKKGRNSKHKQKGTDGKRGLVVDQEGEEALKSSRDQKIEK